VQREILFGKREIRNSLFDLERCGWLCDRRKGYSDSINTADLDSKAFETQKDVAKSRQVVDSLVVGVLRMRRALTYDIEGASF
jgi:hypothetical protein